MRRAKRMAIILTAITILTTLVVSPFTASAQQSITCPELSTPTESDPGFVCRQDVPPFSFFCPVGTVLVPVIVSPDPNHPFFCDPVPPDNGGGGEGGGGDGSGGGSDGSGGSGSAGGGSGGGGAGGSATPITQDSVQESQVGELNQNFDIN